MKDATVVGWLILAVLVLGYSPALAAWIAVGIIIGASLRAWKRRHQ